MTTNGDGMTTDAGKTTGSAATERTALVELDDVSKYYGNIRALEGVSLEVHAGRSPACSATTARASPR